MNKKPDDNIDIDVCMGCGRYYSITPHLMELWRKSFNYPIDKVMPQLCHKCMRNN
jgi:hypothetical protein